MGETGPTQEILVGTKVGSRATFDIIESDISFSLFVLGSALLSVCHSDRAEHLAAQKLCHRPTSKHKSGPCCKLWHASFVSSQVQVLRFMSLASTRANSHHGSCQRRRRKSLDANTLSSFSMCFARWAAALTASCWLRRRVLQFVGLCMSMSHRRN